MRDGEPSSQPASQQLDRGGELMAICRTKGTRKCPGKITLGKVDQIHLLSLSSLSRPSEWWIGSSCPPQMPCNFLDIKRGDNSLELCPAFYCLFCSFHPQKTFNDRHCCLVVHVQDEWTPPPPRDKLEPVNQHTLSTKSFPKLSISHSFLCSSFKWDQATAAASFPITVLH